MTAIDQPLTRPAKSDWRARLRAWRRDLVSKPGFQRWAAGFALTRPLARRRSAQLFDLAAGFVFSQVLHACVALDLFAVLGEASSSTEDLAARLGIPRGRLERLLNAAAELQLVRRDGQGAWELDELGAVVAGNPGIAAMVRHHAMLYRDLTDPVALLRDPGLETETKRFWRYAGDSGGEVGASEAAEYSRLMTLSQDLVTAEILDAYPLGRHRRLLDLGGGEGAFLAAAATRAPTLELALFDLPPVAERARRHLESLGLGERVTTGGGDFFRDPLPKGADLITLVRVLCDHDDASVKRLLENAAAALEDGGSLLIGEPMAGPDGRAGHAAAYFELYFLAMGAGRCRRPEEHVALLRSAGFTRWRRVPTNLPLFASVLVAQR